MEKQDVKDVDLGYTRFRGGEIAVDSYAAQIVLHHLPVGLLRCSISAVDQQLCWVCDHTGKIALETYCNQYQLGREELKWIYGGILKNLKETKEYLLDTNCLILNAGQTYLDPLEKKIWNTYVPFYGKNIWKSLQDISQYFLGHLDKQDPEAVRIAYGMYQYFNQGGHSLEEAWEILCENTSEEKEQNSIEEYHAEMEIKQESIQNQKTDSFRETEQTFPMVGWLLMGLSGSAAIFLVAYTALNEWYMQNLQKMTLLLLAVLLGIIAFLLWKKWGYRMQKKNPLD